MIVLTDDTEALARKVAESRHIPVDVAIRLGLEAIAGKADHAVQSAGSEALVERRRTALAHFAEVIASMPVQDPRAPAVIMDDLNEV
jgi:hypothetical protein